MYAAPLTKDFRQECVLVFFGTCYSLDAYCVHKHRLSSHEHTPCTSLQAFSSVTIHALPKYCLIAFFFFEAVKKIPSYNNY